jgi:hypothetical protein
MFSRCEAENGAGNCEKWGAVVYPKCKPDYSPFGCCICRPNKPDCKALGFQGQFDISCAKKLIIGKPKTGVCAEDEEKSIGLCYKKCPQGFNRQSLVCWANLPPNWVNCGLGAAKDKTFCADVIIDQVAAPLFTATGFSMLGKGLKALKYAGKGLKEAASPAANALKKFASPYAEKFISKKADNPYYRMDPNGNDLDPSKAPGGFEGSQKQFGEEPGFGPIDMPISTEAKSFKQKAIDFMKGSGGRGLMLLGNMHLLMSNESSYTTVADMVRLTALVTSFMDPTGISEIVAAYSYPKCSKLTFNETNFLRNATFWLELPQNIVDGAKDIGNQV